MRVSVQRYFEGLVAELVCCNKHKLQYEDPDLNAALLKMVEHLHDRVSEELRSGNKSIAYDLLEILDTISPNPNTGAFDGLWSELRDLQPRVAFTMNPQHPALQFKLSRSNAEETVKSMPEPWRNIVHESAQYLAAF